MNLHKINIKKYLKIQFQRWTITFFQFPEQARLKYENDVGRKFFNKVMAKRKAKKKPGKAPSPSVPRNQDKDKQGCAVSFLMEERGELDPLCERTPAEMKDEYVQPDKEKEDGGQG